MPTPPTLSNEELVNLSEQLKRRLASASRGRKGNLTPELREELLGALDQLAELGLVGSSVQGETDPQVTEVAPVEPVKPEALSAPVEKAKSHDELAASPELAQHSELAEHSEPTEPANRSPVVPVASMAAVVPVAPVIEPLMAKHPVSSLEADFSRVVADAVTSSLTAWQTQFSETIFQAFADSGRDSGDNLANVELQSLLLQELESELTDTRAQLSTANNQLAEYESDLSRAREQLAGYESDLSRSREQLERAVDRIAEMEFSLLHASNKDEELLELLKQQLEESQSEVADLREQNSELAAKLAQQLANTVTSNSPAGRGNGEQLSWEERKLLILKQLEGDCSSSSPAIPHHEKIEIQEVIDASQLEISRRDEEIDELREIIRMQSDARDGVAIGAAGVAQMLDSDELVQQERQKLREIQQEWEDKLRQAEIDLSMERAKIARERIAMEKQKEELAEMQLNSLPKEKSIERRWLRVLGIKDDRDE